MRIDAHQHFWRLENPFTDWPTPDLETIHRDFAPADLEPLLAAAGVDGTIVVQAAPAVAETDYCLALAGQASFVKGVVGWVDFTDPDCISQIDRFAENPLFRGVRPMLQGIAEPQWILRSEFSPILEHLSKAGLTFDGLVLAHQIPDLLALGQRHPDLKMVLDHGGKPAIANGKTIQWQNDIRQLAAQTGSYCKLSGLWTEAGDDISISRIQPYAEWILECFGPDRVMWGSDWPVVQLAGNYGAWISQCEAMIAHLSPQQQAAIFGGNAATFYGLADA
ncbi:MAG: amidohydrolase family protein [Sphingomonadales bacterium]|nr:amidohydrolase family protein [Sphingomonadales bacterium]